MFKNLKKHTSKNPKWQAFKNDKRAHRSFTLLIIIFTFTLFAEFIANEKPLIINHKGSLYFPVFKKYSETEFGGELPTEADYKDPYVKELIRKNGWMLMPLIEYSHDTINYRTTNPSPPSWKNLLGTDDQGRDILSRLIYGLRLSIIFGLSLTIISSLIGITAGAIQGYFGGKIDIIFQRFLEIWGALPQLFILIILSSLFAPSFLTLLIIMSLFSWTSLVGVTRAEFLRIRNMEYVKSAKAIGLSNYKIITRHVLPNSLTPAITFIPFELAGGITALTALDFLGFGMPSGSPSLGEMLMQAKDNIHAYWIGLSVFLTLSLILILLIFTGEGIRSAYDPKKKYAKMGL